jgi:hypothetical protein
MPIAVGKTLSREKLKLRVAKNRKGDVAYLIDRALAFRFDPSDTLVISGFWRSGTTWLEESLREILYAKTLFEPIDPLLHDTQEVHAHDQVAGKTLEFLRMYMPYCRDDVLPNGHPLAELFRRALRAQLRGAWARRFRQGLAESFRPRLVVKFVNAQLCLRPAQNTFAMPVLHVYRDPRAVVASIKKTRWHGLFDHLSLREQLLEVPDGRAEYFNRWRDEILDYDRYNTVTRIAAYWSLTEKFLQDSYADDQSRFVCISYEQLAQQREKVFAAILEKLSLRPWQKNFLVAEKDSTTTSKKQQGASVNERVAGWRNYLSTTDIAVIESIAQHFGFAERLADDAAAASPEVAQEALA